MWVSKKYKKTKLNRKMCYREIEGFGYIYEVNFKKEVSNFRERIIDYQCSTL